ncbi:hypothetical protein ACVWY6_003232 [Williamsia sp. R60]
MFGGSCYCCGGGAGIYTSIAAMGRSVFSFELLAVSDLTARAILDQPVHRFTALYRQRFVEQLTRVREVLGS